MEKDRLVLISCNTYMQLITAIQIRQSVFREDRVDVLLSDHSINAQSVCERMQETGIFSSVRYVKSKRIMYNQNRLESAKDVLALACDFKTRFQEIVSGDLCYDAVFFFNQNDYCALYGYQRSLKNKNNVAVFCYEEGIFSYDTMAKITPCRRMRAIMILRSLLHKKNMLNEVQGYYCYYPELFPKNSVNCYPIPHLNRHDQDFVDAVNKTFDYHPEIMKYPQRYVFFASSSDVDGRPCGETELVLRIAELIGRENLLVKMHPRDGRDVYEKQGISVSRNSSIPWEVIQLNHDFSNHVFLTVSSGSVVNASLMLGDQITTFFLYPLVKGRNAAIDSFCENSIQPTLKELKRIDALKCVKTISNLNEIVL